MPIKILHYCWFGGNPLPSATVKFIDSWKKYLPDFEIKRWDESNFDVNSIPFVQQAYAAKKWAFVSDYVRAYILYNYGGLYVDTDVEFVKPIDDLLGDSFAGFETPDYVAPGLILYAEKLRLPYYKDLLDYYQDLTFSVDTMDEITSPKIYTEFLCKRGLKRDGTLQNVDGIIVYPAEYFNPIGAHLTDRPVITENTRSIHHYEASWFNSRDKELLKFRKKFGERWGRVLYTFRHPILAFKRKLKRR